MDRVTFLVSTNPGQAPGRLEKIASGGELSRLMLALKVVLARGSPVPTLVFDEVDSGIGGATAAAVGERLSRVAERCRCWWSRTARRSRRAPRSSSASRSR